MTWSFDESPGLVGWLLTYAVHGTALLSSAWVLCRVVGRRLPDPVHETVWKAAVVVPLVTASLQVMWVAEPVAGHLAHLEVASKASASEGDTAALRAFDVGESELWTFVPPLESPPSAPTASAPQDVSWERTSAVAIVSLSLLAFLFRLRSARRLRTALRDRTPIVDGELRAILDRLCVTAGFGRRVRLSLSAKLGTPVAFGSVRPEICLPTKVAARLTEQQRVAVIGHELGHLVRRDPLWLSAFGWLTVLFAWQPLLRVARREYQQLAEYRCDAFAADIAGHLPVARCLLEVAELVARPWRRISSAMAMAAPASLLKRRIDRLLQRGRSHRAGLHRLWLVPAVPAAVVTMTLAAPGVSVEGAGPARTATAPVTLDEAAGTSLLDQLDAQWTLLQMEVASLDEVVAELPADDEIRHLRNLVVEKLRVIATRRERIRQLIETPASGPAEASQEGGSR